MKELIYSKNNLVIAIYAVVLITMVFISKPEVEYGMTIRLLLFGAAMFPLLFSSKYIIFSFTCIYSINSTSFCRILPSDAYYYYILIFIAFCICKRSNEMFKIMWKCGVAIIPFYFISLIHGDAQDFQLWWAVCLLFIPFLNNEQNLKLLAFSFPVASLVLSLLFLLNQAYFMFSYSVEVERSGWINANQFGGIIGLGVVVGIALIIKQIKLNITFKETVLLLVCVVVSYIVVVLNASRGAFISTSLTSLIFVFMSNIKNGYKILIIVALIFFAFLLWQSGFFELLMFRMEADTASTAGSRSLIWAEKLDSFFNEGTPLQWLLGAGGRAGAEMLGHSRNIYNMSTHNDFVTVIVGFGIPCFLYYIYLLFYPYFNMPKGHDRNVLGAFMIFLFLESSVLEPMFRGYVSYIMFYIFLFTYSHYMKRQFYKL